MYSFTVLLELLVHSAIGNCSFGPHELDEFTLNVDTYNLLAKSCETVFSESGFS